MKALIQEADVLLKNGGHRNLIEMDTSFHEIIYQATQNPILQEILENLHGRCARLWNSALSGLIPIATIISQLKEVYSSLEKGDAENAAKLMEAHVRYFIDRIKSQLL